MSKPTTFAVSVYDDGEDCHVECTLVTAGDMPLEEAIGVFAAAATEPDEATVTLGSGLTVKLVERPDNEEG